MPNENKEPESVDDGGGTFFFVPLEHFSIDAFSI